ncbi:MAG: hypothetical protein KIT58_04410 [Planctomycetota bacterium]|nr:hypothetical protein [Planctomycetota bacterium]
MSGLAHGLAGGLAARGVGLGARLGQRVELARALAPGEVTRYLLLTTAGTLVGRLLALGLEDELPLLVRGDVAAARRLAWVGFWPLVAGAAAGAAALMVGGAVTTQALTVAAAALVLAGTLVLVGLLRTLSATLYEQVLNAPPVLHLVAAASAPALDAPRLVLLGAGAQAVVALWVARQAGLIQLLPTRPNGPGGLGPHLRGGLGKLAANLLLVAQVRALGWLPSLVGAAAADALSYAVLVGEAGLQLATGGYPAALRRLRPRRGSPRLAARRGGAAWAALARWRRRPGSAPGGLLARPRPAWALVAAGAWRRPSSALLLLVARARRALSRPARWPGCS